MVLVRRLGVRPFRDEVDAPVGRRRSPDTPPGGVLAVVLGRHVVATGRAPVVVAILPPQGDVFSAVGALSLFQAVGHRRPDPLAHDDGVTETAAFPVGGNSPPILLAPGPRPTRGRPSPRQTPRTGRTDRRVRETLHAARPRSAMGRHVAPRPSTVRPRETALRVQGRAPLTDEGKTTGVDAVTGQDTDPDAETAVLSSPTGRASRRPLRPLLAGRPSCRSYCSFS